MPKRFFLFLKAKTKTMAAISVPLPWFFICPYGGETSINKPIKERINMSYPKVDILYLSEKDMLIVKDKEGKKILSKIKNNSYVIALAIDGKNLSSEELADTMSNLAVRGNSHITFVIGGSLGLSDEVLKRADYKLSFSKMTFPHQLLRLILLEQVYRAFRINNNEPYHK